MHTNHTVLMHINSKDRTAKKGTFVASHPCLVEGGRSVEFINNKLVHEDTDWSIVKFRVSSSRRFVVSSSPLHVDSSLRSADTISKFLHEKKSALAAEAVRFDVVKGIDSGADAATIWINPDFAKASDFSAEEFVVDETPAINVDPEPADEKAPTPVIPAVKSTWIDNVYVEAEQMRIFETLFKLGESGEISNLLMVGPSGYGKTTVPEVLANDHDLKFLRINCAAVRDPEQWFGYPEARDGETVFIKTELTKTLEAGNAVVVLDEFNRVEPWMHNILFPLLDHARKTTVHNMEISCGPNIIFVATLNLGFEYTGTFMMDEAMTNRFDAVIKVGPLPKSIEMKVLVKKIGIDEVNAKRIVNVLTRLRSRDIGADVSTRTALKVARLVSTGMIGLKDAFKAVIINALEEADMKVVVDAVNMVD